MKRVPTIGLEIHAELRTASKMFCDSPNDPEERHPNMNVCPVCMGHPGTLPVINRQAVEHVIKVGMAVQGEIPLQSKFDRKNYFYPDLPKGYQISQYDLPLVFGGRLAGVRIRRVHLEEDTARLAHEASPDTTSERRGSSLVDFNRAGVPLMELVTEPDIKNAEEAVHFAEELQLLLRYLGASNANMEKGEMRVEVNISLREDVEGSSLGTKVEVKNINSFKAVRGAIETEIKRQGELLNEGKAVRQETRGWDDTKNTTISQRIKEDAHDYRYFPEPDLPPLDMSKFNLGELKRAIPELPQEKRLRFGKEYGLAPAALETLVRDMSLAEFFEEAVSELVAEEGKTDPKRVQLLTNYLLSDLRGLLTMQGIGFNECKITPENFADLIELIAQNKVSSRGAKDLLLKMLNAGGDPHELMRAGNMEQVSDESALSEIVTKIIEAHPQVVADYKSGKTNALQFLVGKAMAELKGKGNPGVLQKLLRKILQ